MENKKIEYYQIAAERMSLQEQINALASDEQVKKYMELCSQNNLLANQEKNLYREFKTAEYSSCKHIWVESFCDYNSREGRRYTYLGCIKCGLDEKILYLMEGYQDPNLLTLEQRLMYDYLKDYRVRGGIKALDLRCNIALGKAIYQKIKEAHPNIDDETALKYFKVALDSIRNNKVSEERKKSRARRLSLNPKFNRWGR